MRIPKSLKLMGHTVKVECLPPAKWKQKECVGYFSPRDMKIAVLKRPGTGTEHAFTHELTHAMLYCMGHALYEDEQFVDTLGGLLHQAMNSAKYPEPLQPRRSRKPKA